MSGGRLRRSLAVLVAAAVVGVSASCSSQQDRYCDAAAEAGPELRRLADGDRAPLDASLRVLPTLERLAGESPPELVDEWQTLINALRAFRDALAAADIELTDGAAERIEQLDPEQRTAVQAAAARLARDSVLDASRGIEAFTGDVCDVSLGL